MEKHFATFYSPGTFTAETRELPIEAWDTDLAVTMARTIVERHGAKPYGFRFTTRSRAEDDLDSTVSKNSLLYFIGGRIETLEEVEARDDPSESILRDNMRSIGWNRIVVNENSYRWTMPLNDGDVVLDVQL